MFDKAAKNLHRRQTLMPEDNDRDITDTQRVAGIVVYVGATDREFYRLRAVRRRMTQAVVRAADKQIGLHKFASVKIVVIRSCGDYSASIACSIWLQYHVQHSPHWKGRRGGSGRSFTKGDGIDGGGAQTVTKGGHPLMKRACV
jgi:hypothetical protein